MSGPVLFQVAVIVNNLSKMVEEPEAVAVEGSGLALRVGLEFGLAIGIGIGIEIGDRDRDRARDRGKGR